MKVGDSVVAKIPPVTNEQWMECNEWNRKIIEKFLNQQTLSDKTLEQYTSAIKIFARYVKDEFDNKPIHKLKPRHALDYQNYLLSLGLSPNAVKFKRSVVSSLCGFIELYYGEDFPEFRNIYNKAIKSPPKAYAKEKKYIPKEDFERLVITLEEQEEYQMVAYLLFSYITGARRAEVAQAKKSFFEMDKVKGKEFYITPTVRGKGAGKQGKPTKLIYDDRARNAILKWLKVRGDDDCEYVFVRKLKDGTTTPLQPDTFNGWFDNKFNQILGIKSHPHMLRRSRATHLVVDDGKDINTAKRLLGHNDSSTTEHYVMRDDTDELDDIF